VKLAAIGGIVTDQHMQTIRNGVYAAEAPDEPHSFAPAYRQRQ
jgi:hypothetical protein